MYMQKCKWQFLHTKSRESSYAQIRGGVPDVGQHYKRWFQKLQVVIQGWLKQRLQFLLSSDTKHG